MAISLFLSMLTPSLVSSHQPDLPPKVTTTEVKPRILAGGIPFPSKVYVQEYFKGDGSIRYVVFEDRNEEILF